MKSHLRIQRLVAAGALSCALLTAFSGPAAGIDPVTAVTVASGVVAIVGAVWATGVLVHGGRVTAYAEADGATASDPPGITHHDKVYKPPLPFKGGWFSAGEDAIAPITGPRGSSLTTQASTSYIGLTFRGSVTYPTQIFGGTAGSFLWGCGRATGGTSTRIFRIGDGPTSAGPGDNVADISVPFSIERIDLSTHEGGTNGVHIRLRSWASPNGVQSQYEPFDPAAGDLAGELFNGSVQLVGLDEAVFQGGLNPSMFTAPSNGQMHLLNPLYFNIPSSVVVPPAWGDEFYLAVVSDVESDNVSAIPVPALDKSGLLILGLLQIVVALFFLSRHMNSGRALQCA